LRFSWKSDRQGQSSRPFLARSFPPLLIEGSVRPEQFGALPRGRGPHARSGSGHSTREGRGLGRCGCP
jgi:hypothetical protein